MKFIYKNTAGITDSTIASGVKKLSEYVAHCRTVVAQNNYEADEASLCLPDDPEILNEVAALADKKKQKNLKHIIVAGIGGSNFGTKAIYDAVYGAEDPLTPERFPKMLFLDTTDPEYLSRFVARFGSEKLQEGEVIVNIISKSGGTTETAVNGELLIDIFKKKFKNWKGMFVVTTDRNSPLWNASVAAGIDVLPIPKKVGGRYSVFSAVGLFPLALAGMDIKKVLESAAKMRNACLIPDEGNPALSSAVILYAHLENAIAINDNFYFHAELEPLGKWYRQLMGESTGKNGMGLTPTVSVGSVDLHSVVQLYLGGPKNKYTSFVYTDSFPRVPLPAVNALSHIKEIEGKSAGDIMTAVQKGTMATYANLSLPYCEVALDGVTAEEIAAYMQFKMLEIMYLGKLMNVNAFDQPQVELYKIETKKILAAK